MLDGKNGVLQQHYVYYLLAISLFFVFVLVCSFIALLSCMGDYLLHFLTHSVELYCIYIIGGP